MGGLGTWLLSLVPALTSKVLRVLGFAVVTYAGVGLAVDQILASARGAWGQQVGDVASLVSMAGANTALSIVAGALAARLTLETFKRLEPK